MGRQRERRERKPAVGGRSATTTASPATAGGCRSRRGRTGAATRRPRFGSHEYEDGAMAIFHGTRRLARYDA